MTVLILGATPPVPAVETVTVIANPQAPTDSLSHAALRAIFSMRLRQWPGDGPVIVYVLPDNSDTHVSFSKQVLRIFPYVLRDSWDRLVFTGTGPAPIQVLSEDELIRRVAMTPGGIGYVQKDRSLDHVVKVVQVK